MTVGTDSGVVNDGILVVKTVSTDSDFRFHMIVHEVFKLGEKTQMAS